jgi:Flp pilus assembly protein TadB
MLIIFLIVLAVILVIVLVVAVIGLRHRRQRGRTLANSTRYNDPAVTNRENYPDQGTNSMSQDADAMRTAEREQSSTTTSGERSASSDKRNGYR